MRQRHAAVVGEHDLLLELCRAGGVLVAGGVIWPADQAGAAGGSFSIPGDVQGRETVARCCSAVPEFVLVELEGFVAGQVAILWAVTVYGGTVRNQHLVVCRHSYGAHRNLEKIEKNVEI